MVENTLINQEVITSMGSQSTTALTFSQPASPIEEELAKKLEIFLHPVLLLLDAYLDKRLLQTSLKSIASILVFRNFKQGLYLSELGAYLQKGVRNTAATKRISNLLHSGKWKKEIIEGFLWDRAEQ